jgi:hypothetical protein
MTYFRYSSNAQGIFVSHFEENKLNYLRVKCKKERERGKISLPQLCG